MNDILQLDKDYTRGNFSSEAEAWAYFDAVLLKASTSFRSYREVDGEYIQPRPGTESKSARIDRILIPIAGAVDAGWRDGAIGVEGKKSGHKLGRLICQGLDYSRCVWRLADQHKPGPPGMSFITEWVFLYPVADPGCDLGSVMAQNRIGHVAPGWRGGLVFSCGGTHGIEIDADGAVKAKQLSMGRKRGSR